MQFTEKYSSADSQIDNFSAKGFLKLPRSMKTLHSYLLCTRFGTESLNVKNFQHKKKFTENNVIITLSPF